MGLVHMWVSEATQVGKLINYKTVYSLTYFSFMKVMEGMDSRRECGV